MEKELTKAFSNIKYEAAPDLAENVWRTILLRNKRIAGFKLLAFSLLGLASLLALVPAIKMLSSDFTKSGFYEYMSLLFSDGKTLVIYWREFAFSLAESLPVSSILWSLTLIFVFFLSMKYALKQIISRELPLSFKV